MADVVIKIVDFECPLATGLIDITTTALGGRTPKAVLFLGTSHVPGADGTGFTKHARMTLGATDGTNHATMAFRGQDGIANSLTSRREMRTTVPLIAQALTNSTTFSYVAAFDSFITNGIRLNFTTVDTVNEWRIIAIFFAGDDLSAAVGSQDLGTGTSALDITAPGFEPDVVFGFGSNGEISDGNELFYGCMFGICVNDGSATQKGQSLQAPSAAAENMAQIIWSNRIGGRKATGDTTVAYDLLISDFDASGFSITPSASASNDDWLYLALNLGGTLFALWDFSTPTSGGAASDVTPDFEPQFGLTCTTFLLARDTGTFDGSVGTIGIGVFDGDATWAAWAGASWFASSTHTSEANGRTMQDVVVGFDPTADGVGSGIQADFVGFDGVGWDVNYNLVDASARMAFGLAIGLGNPSVGGSGHRAVTMIL